MRQTHAVQSDPLSPPAPHSVRVTAGAASLKHRRHAKSRHWESAAQPRLTTTGVPGALTRSSRGHASTSRPTHSPSLSLASPPRVKVVTCSPCGLPGKVLSSGGRPQALQSCTAVALNWSQLKDHDWRAANSGSAAAGCHGARTAAGGRHSPRRRRQAPTHFQALAPAGPQATRTRPQESIRHHQTPLCKPPARPQLPSNLPKQPRSWRQRRRHAPPPV